MKTREIVDQKMAQLSIIYNTLSKLPFYTW